MMFYFDNEIGNYERNFQWDLSLVHLEDEWICQHNEKILNSLIGFSWYYILEGPVESQRFERDECKFGLKLWRKYIDIGLKDFCNNLYCNFIAGYTLNLSGILIDKNFNVNYEALGINLLYRCTQQFDDATIRKLSLHILQMQNVKRYKQLVVKREDLIKVFGNQSLIGKYFCEIY